ncbi:MAG: class 1 fructose-bisphosphatase [Cyanobacteria bacterium P01_A01_bin.3]
MVATAPTSLDSSSDRELTQGFMTLSRHVLQSFGNYSSEAQDFSSLLHRISLAGKMIGRNLSKAGLVENTLGVTGSVNVQGEEVKKMDEYANAAFIRAIEQSGLVCRLVSEEMEDSYHLPENCSLGRYAVLFDPIDGSSNIDADLSIGSIFSIIRAEGADVENNEDVLQPGHKQLAAGYILYGPSTQFVYSMGKGVHAFILDPSLGEFVLWRENIQTPERGSTYSVNEGYYCHWAGAMQEFIRYVHRTDGYSARYSGALVADVHRILMYGGVYLYPGTVAKPDGKLRLLYEASPLAYLLEQAGGSAVTTGGDRILDIHPTDLHQRVPLVIGSSTNVSEVDAILREHAETGPSC